MKLKGASETEPDSVQMANHVGGISDSLGGIDPEIDELLMRLSGGP